MGPDNDSTLMLDTAMTLTDTVINTVKPTTKPFKLRDGEGMYLLIMPTDQNTLGLITAWMGKG
jgi:hypothetical protein